jgi:hypothetical protein
MSNWAHQLLEKAVGCDLEIVQEEFIYRGRIGCAEVRSGDIVFTLPWVAKCDTDNDESKWRVWHAATCSFPIDSCSPRDMGGCQALFIVPGEDGLVIVHLDPNDHLDPLVVEGLRVD